jgi:outer membrane protein OmpA-like peptidoglycan-associated protein
MEEYLNSKGRHKYVIMKNSKLIFSVILLIISIKVNAQSFLSVSDVTADTIKFADNLYINVNAGSQILFSKDAEKLDLMERFTPSFSLVAGKWFSPVWGLRLGVQGYALNGFSTVDGLYVADPESGNIYGNDDPVRNNVTIRPDGSYRHYIRFINSHVDFQFSLVNLLTENMKESRWDVAPSVGLGYMRVVEYKGIPAAGIISANVGLSGTYRLSNKLDINAEVQATMMPDQFDGRIAGKLYENYCSAGLGIKYYFGKRGFKKPIPKPITIAIPEPVIREIHIRDTVYLERNAAVVENPIKEIPERTFTLSVIQFRSESANPISGQDLAISNIASFLEKNPDATIRLEGYADSRTGTEKYNYDLSQRRVRNIYNLLVNEYKIDPGRLVIKVVGGTAQPYEKLKWNRVVMAIAVVKGI